MKNIFDYIKEKKKEQLPLIARVNLAELQKQREAEISLRDVSILAAANYSKKLPTIRLFYVALEKFTRYGSTETKLGQTFGVSSPFKIPKDMSIEDALKVISHLSEGIESELNIEPASERSVSVLSKVLTDFGFEKVEGYYHGHSHAVSKYNPLSKINITLPECEKIDGVIDLFTVGGDFRLFNKSNLQDRYFNWFTEGISKNEILEIYDKIWAINLSEENLNNLVESKENTDTLKDILD